MKKRGRLNQPQSEFADGDHAAHRARRDSLARGTSDGTATVNRSCFLRAAMLPLLVVAGLVACDTARDRGADPEPGATSPVTAESPALPAMAVTIDDLPWIGTVHAGEDVEAALGRLITALADRGVPAAAYANCERAAPGAPRLRQWVDAGLELGNHSAAHLDLNTASLDTWLRDVRSCHRMIREITGQDRIYFRYPFLHQGPDPARQQAALDLLRELDSPIAHVTIDNSDWILSAAYREAVAAGDTQRQQQIAEDFVEHVLAATRHYQQVARTRVGRDIHHVLLLHANVMVADHAGTLLDRLAAEGFRFITVREAHDDPVYSLTDDYTGRLGLSWLYRLHPAAPELAAWDDAEAARLRARWR
jgi:peptidoglycan-N-acetylglucosamine deacetylase